MKTIKGILVVILTTITVGAYAQLDSNGRPLPKGTNTVAPAPLQQTPLPMPSTPYAPTNPQVPNTVPPSPYTPTAPYTPVVPQTPPPATTPPPSPPQAMNEDLNDSCSKDNSD